MSFLKEHCKSLAIHACSRWAALSFSLRLFLPTGFWCPGRHVAKGFLEGTSAYPRHVGKVARNSKRQCCMCMKHGKIAVHARHTALAFAASIDTREAFQIQPIFLQQHMRRSRKKQWLPPTLTAWSSDWQNLLLDSLLMLYCRNTFAPSLFHIQSRQHTATNFCESICGVA